MVNAIKVAREMVEAGSSTSFREPPVPARR